MGRKWSIAAVVLLLLPAAAAAQGIEVGASASLVCRGSEGSLCGGEDLAVGSVHASLWLGPAFEVQGRFGGGGLDDRQFYANRDGRFPPGAPERVTFDLYNRRLRYLTASALYHFRRGRRIRPLAGVGFGTFDLPYSRRCEPSGCESFLTTLVGPGGSEPRRDVVLTGGLSVRATERVLLRFGLSAHNFGGEDLSSMEWFAGAGWRLWR